MPRLDLTLLEQAGAETAGQKGGAHRTNVRDAYELAKQFNADYKENYSEPEVRAQIKRLDGILETAGRWMTSRTVKKEGGAVSPAKADKNQRRWAALARLCEACSLELIAMGFRPLTGHWSETPMQPPADPTQTNYWLERLDPLHRGAPMLKTLYTDWANLAPDSPHAALGFFDYVTAIRRGSAGDPKVLYNKGTEEDQAAARRIRRRQSQVLLDDGGLFRVTDDGGRGAAFTTAGMKTEYAGTGFGIFVWDHKGRVYSSNHIANSLHHSTHRGGRPVRCAGEWRTSADGSSLVFVTSKTGHYKTTPAEFRSFLAFLRERNVLNPATLCVPDTSESAVGSWTAFGALDWLAGNGQRKTREQVVQLLPGLEATNKNFWLKLTV